ncbi:PREDICTED: uncharacterized protein LOC105457429 [Wasmannia auropunctata]|uniref:uncharacterized protein LOC105457429 n=1 Tax=Wasmannia auropunctata TaxID=64793 RepID=UPI0005EDEDAA|nr:PREDICTED: uncharacterized protein LOC105457429 [Wasmannia auropunctata]
MLRLSRGLRCQGVRLFAPRDGRKSCVTQFPGGGDDDGKASFGTEERHVLTVSRTRGVPSTSMNLKEALCEKIPVHHDLLRNFRFHFGPSVVSQITVEDLYAGLSDVKTIVKETSELHPKHGVIIAE